MEHDGQLHLNDWARYCAKETLCSLRELIKELIANRDMDETLLQLVKCRIAENSGHQEAKDKSEQDRLESRLQQYNTLIDQTRSMKIVFDRLFAWESLPVKYLW